MSESFNPYLESDGSRRSLVVAEERGRLTERAELLIGGVPWGDYARDVQVENSGDEGGSTLTFISRRPLKKRVDDEVVLTLDRRPYFTGTLKRPGEDSGSRWQKTAVALGPFAEMAGQWFTEQTSYVGYSLRGALLNIFSLSSTVSGYGDVQGGDNIPILEADFTKDTTLIEGATSLITPANFVLLDRQDGTKFAMRRPRPGSAGSEAAFYTPDDYAQGDFTVDWTATQPFSKVDVYRLADDNSYAVRDVRDVMVEGSRMSASSRRRWWFVPDWPGDQASCTAEAVQLSRELMGMGTFSLTVRLAPKPWRWDSFVAQRIVEEEGGAKLETIDCVVSDNHSGDFAADTMTLSGDALLRSSVPYDDSPSEPPEVLNLPNPYLIGG